MYIIISRTYICYIQHVNDFNMPVLESSIVKLTPEAFLNPTAYLDTAETKSSVKRMTDFISGDISTNPGLKVIGGFFGMFLDS